MLGRPSAHDRIARALRRSRAVLLLGPRQCGKTTLARGFVPAGSVNYFDLESPSDARRLGEPMSALAPLRGTVVIDEVQRHPELFPVLRVLADRRPLPARFLLLGSASPQLLRQSSESLAGRVELVELGPFTIDEVGVPSLDRRWLRGGFPRSYLARSTADSAVWRNDFVSMIIERDVPFHDARLPAATVRRMWTMFAHLHGQTAGLSSVAASLGIHQSTVRRHLDLMEGLFVVRQLQPWFENVGKRQVKSPRLYFRDTGVLHSLLDIDSAKSLLGNPRCGASWEGLFIEELLMRAPHSEAYWWSTHQGAELDLLLMHRGKRWGVEFKRADAPTATKSMHVAMETLGLSGLTVVAPVARGYALADRMRVASPAEVVADPALVVR